MNEIMTDKRKVTVPVLVIKGKDSEQRVWALNDGEWCQLSPAPCHYFHAMGSASLIYESISKAGGHQAEEVSLRDPGTWDWIQSLAVMGNNAAIKSRA